MADVPAHTVSYLSRLSDEFPVILSTVGFSRSVLETMALKQGKSCSAESKMTHYLITYIFHFLYSISALH